MTNKALSAKLYTLIQRLMQDPVLGSFYLVGGTGLALHLEHRKSDDIDLFNSKDFDSSLLAMHLEKSYAATQLVWEPNTVRSFIDGIKVEFISHQYPLLGELKLMDGIRVASLKDISAFKLNAISGRGSKKDFWDLDALLDHFSLAEMLDFFKAKYAANDFWHLIRSLYYFDDAEKELIEIKGFHGKNWTDVKKNILRSLQDLDT